MCMYVRCVVVHCGAPQCSVVWCGVVYCIIALFLGVVVSIILLLEESIHTENRKYAEIYPLCKVTFVQTTLINIC